MISSISAKSMARLFTEQESNLSDYPRKVYQHATGSYAITTMSTPRPSTHGFQRTSTNKLFTKDIDTIFSMLMVALNLQEHPRRRKQSFLASKPHPFSFTVEDALIAIQNLSVMIVSGSTKTTISCSVSSDSASLFLERFMSARLLHCPADRTRSTPKHGTVLQPTAKGVFFIQRYCDANGIVYNSPLLYSPLNSMRCFSFDRDPISDTIICNDALVYILFQRLMGPNPNVYSAASEPISDSPYAHRYFTNPKSDALSQYYLSETGIRLSVVLVDSKDRTALSRYIFTGRAMWQWMLDCTDLVYQSEAHLLVNKFLAHNIIELESPAKHGSESDSSNNSSLESLRSRLSEDTVAPLDDDNDVSGKGVYNAYSTMKNSGRVSMTTKRKASRLSLNKDVYYRLTDTGKYLVTWPIYANQPATPIASTYAQAAAAAAAVVVKAANSGQTPSNSGAALSVAAPPASNCISEYQIATQQAPSIILGTLKPPTIFASPYSKKSRHDGSNTSSICQVDKNSFCNTDPTATSLLSSIKTATPPPPESPKPHYTLRETLDDAGLNWLFTQYLRDNHCEENLLFYKDLTKFLVDFAQLREVLRRQRAFEADAAVMAGDPMARTPQMLLRAEALTCLQICNNTIYVMYNRFLSESAPCELNIDSQLRARLVNAITSHLKRKGGSKKSSENKCGSKGLSKDKENGPLIFDPSTSSTNLNSSAKNVPSSTQNDALPLQFEDIFIDNLVSVSKLLEQTKVQVYRTMETDSLPKFLMSDLYVEGMKSITVLKKKLKQQQIQMQSCN